MIKHSPKRDPKFHRMEMFAGVGRSTTAPFAILNSGWFLRMGIAIRIVVKVLRRWGLVLLLLGGLLVSKQ